MDTKVPRPLVVRHPFNSGRLGLAPGKATRTKRNSLQQHTHTPRACLGRVCAVHSQVLDCLRRKSGFPPRHATPERCATTPRPPKVPDSGSSNVVSERTTSHVCRIQFQSPAVGDLFYLRLSVASQGVCVLVPSLHALRTVSSAAGFFETEHETCQHAARRALGLVVVAMENILSAWKKPPCTK